MPLVVLWIVRGYAGYGHDGLGCHQSKVRSRSGVTRMGRDSKLTPHIVVQAMDYAARWRNSRHLSRAATRLLRAQVHYHHLWLEARHPQQQRGYHWPWLLR